MVAHFTLRTNDENKVFFRKKIGFYDSFDVTNAFNKSKCLVKSMCAHSEMSNHLI